MTPWLAIAIDLDPNIAEIGGFVLTWHGVFTAVGILVGVQLSLWVARRVDFDEDIAYTLALVGVPSGIIGARALYVAEHWEVFGQNPAQIFAITEGGISIWGAVLGGFGGALLFALWRGYPIRTGLDVASFGMITGMGIGRIGDLINGEHWARATELPWGVFYTHPDSPGFGNYYAVGDSPVHPATTYEMLGDFAILGILFYACFVLFKHRPGLTFVTFFAGYAVMRYLLSFLRLDSADTFLPGATVPQLVSIVAVIAVLPFAVYCWRNPVPETGDDTPRPGRVEVRSR